MLGGDPDAPAALEDGAEALRCQTHGRGVDDGHQLCQMVCQHPVVQVLVAVLKRHQAAVLVDGFVGELELFVKPHSLLVLAVLTRRQETGQIEQSAFLGAEGAAFVQKRFTQHVLATGVGMNGFGHGHGFPERGDDSRPRVVCPL